MKNSKEKTNIEAILKLKKTSVAPLVKTYTDFFIKIVRLTYLVYVSGCMNFFQTIMILFQFKLWAVNNGT